MDNFCASSSASVSVSATSPGLLGSLTQPPTDTPNQLAIENPSVDLTNETDETEPCAKRSKKLTSDVWAHFTKYEITKEDKDGVFFHVRCLNHILNLVAQDGLKTIASAISNIRTTVTIVKKSTQQYEQFKKCAVECDLNQDAELSLDVPTRWNSTHGMLQAAIYFRDAFDRLFLRQRKKYKKCAPTSKNWEMASKICGCLKLFDDATKLFSGHKYPTANLFFISFCKIKIAISEWCASSDPVIKSMAFSMKLKYEKYWEKSNMALAVACFFDPRYKRNVIEYYAPKIYPTTYEEEIEKFTRVVEQLFEAYVSVSKKTPSSGTNVCQGSSQHAFVVDDGLDSFLNSKRKNSVRGMKTELEVYMEQDLVPRTENGFNILSWWKEHQVEYPILSKLVRDILSIQVSTVASESAFSAGGRVVDPFRSRLDPETVQALICTKDWIAASEGANVESVLKDLDMESLERNFATMVHMLEEQEDDNADDLEDFMDLEED